MNSVIDALAREDLQHDICPLTFGEEVVVPKEVEDEDDVGYYDWSEIDHYEFCWAYLELNMQILSKPGRDHQKLEVMKWIADDENQDVGFSFDAVCKACGCNAEEIRRQIRRMLKKDGFLDPLRNAGVSGPIAEEVYGRMRLGVNDFQTLLEKSLSKNPTMSFEF